MTDKQWNNLLDIVNGDVKKEIPIAFIIDCPWLPNWYGISILDYFSNDDIWYKANMKAIETFPDVMFLPGFWSEYGMCTEPSAFGAKCIFWKNEFPFAEKTINAIEDIDNVTKPNCDTDGLLPFMLNRLVMTRPKIEEAGHKIKFSVSRGPMNIASFLMGTTEFLTAIMMDPERVHKLMRVITDFLKDWHKMQADTIPTIEGILMLDDIVGFVGEEEFKEFGLPYFKELYDVEMAIKFFHNDADCTMSVKYYPEMGVNLYNPGIHMTINELKETTDNKITMLGSIPPRDILASGTPEIVAKEVKDLIGGLKDKSRFVLSCAGGMPPNVSTENINALIEAAK
ncbi:uroporphyrinogen decarboxylase family protein [Bacteroidota bacterium]